MMYYLPRQMTIPMLFGAPHLAPNPLEFGQRSHFIFLYRFAFDLYLYSILENYTRNGLLRFSLLPGLKHH